ncbi:DUF3226 domain-containing protein [Thiofilum flexile]|uniref:DUF3226 domain-containing protein n=1 Tax=Thiofilum flexile TaxID=125627 RepID=UPI00039AF15B|nr:DUF3226 domain-containing protein [Thiofilum flexile]
MSKNVLIVESQNDKFFIENLLKHINKTAIIVENPICSIDDYECLEGLSLVKLKHKLTEIQTTIEKDDIQKLGIIVDADTQGVDQRLELVNQALIESGFDTEPLEFNSWRHCHQYDVDLSCHVLNYNGEGELETLLRAIKNQESSFADCLSAWEACLTSQGKVLSKKDFDKFWINIYQRYDNCSKNDKKQAGRKCSFEASMAKPIWDFEHPALSGLKNYLGTFN